MIDNQSSICPPLSEALLGCVLINAQIGGPLSGASRKNARNWVSIAFTVWTSTRRGASMWARYHHGGTTMKKLSMLGIVGGAALLAAVPFSLQWSEENVGTAAVSLLTLSQANAQPYRRHVRRVYRRAYRRAYYGYPYSYGGYSPYSYGGYYRPSYFGRWY